MKLYGIIGAGGFGREVLPVAKAQLEKSSADFDIVFVDDNKSLPREINGYRVLSTEEFIDQGYESVKFNISIADYSTRKTISERMEAAGIEPFSITAPNSIQFDNNVIGAGAILCPFTTITSNIRVGKYFHASYYSYVGHDCVIGDYVTFAPRVNCNGSVTIEDDAYIGTAAIIKQGTPDRPINIGRGAVVGMGAVVNKSVPEYTVVAGNPAKRIGTVK